jgi:hypothetical protein
MILEKLLFSFGVNYMVIPKNIEIVGITHFFVGANLMINA